MKKATTRPIDKRIRHSRKRLGNPYAYWNGGRDFEAEFDEAAPDVHSIRRSLKNPWAYVDEEGRFANWREAHYNENRPISGIDLKYLLGDKRQGQRFSNREIEQITRKLLGKLWRDHKQASKSANINPLDVIDPVIALEQLGYSVDGDADIGQYQEGGEVFEVAGIIDRESSVVRVSGRFAPAVRNFTIAHELAHAVLHHQSGLHRDRAQDGSIGSRPAEDRLETEANTFASYFLMPAKQVRAAFEQRFLTLDFKLNENTAFALAAQPYADLESRCRTTRDLATMLARTEHYNGKRFHSLANQFGVSVQAMAIRIDELALIRV